MTLMSWENRFELGVGVMDDEHRVLIDSMNRLYACCTMADRAAQEDALRALHDFTREHFEHEERFMADVDFPGRDAHRGHHARLLKTFDQHIERFEAGAELGEKFFDFLRFWLASHICGVDRDYGTFAESLPLARGA